MPHTKIACAEGIKMCNLLINDAKKMGLDAKVPHPTVSPHILEITTTPYENGKLDDFIQKYENNPNITIFYDYTHNKCTKKRFHVNVLPKDETKPTQNAGAYIPGVPETILPPDMRTYYLFPEVTDHMRSIIPRRPKIGVISLGGSYLMSDLDSYWTKCRFRDFKPIIIDRPVADHIIPEFARDIESLENTLDIELIGGFCPSSEIYFYSAPNNEKGYFDAFEAAILDEMDIVSTSWGLSEEKFYLSPKTLLKEYDDLFYRGVTGIIRSTGEKVTDHYTIITSATGDYGSSDNNYDMYDIDIAKLKEIFPNIPPANWKTGVKYPLPHADFPATSPWVVACGGTSLYKDPDIDPTLGDKESCWIYAGGGQSAYFPRPDFQTQNNPWKDSWALSPLAYGQFLNKFGHTDPTTKPRTIPDMVFNADPNSPWYIYFSSYDDEGAGTSTCAPVMAGLLGEFFIASKPNAAPRNGYFGEGFNVNLYRSADINVKRITRGYNVTVDRDPITRDENPFGLLNDSTNTFYFIWENDLAFTFCSGKGTIKGQELIIYLDTVVCVAHGTRILLSDGQLKPIEQIVRGDTVVGYEGKNFKVADVNRQFISKNATIDLVEFLPNSLGHECPSRNLYITPNHPIFYKNTRKPAKSFRHLPNVIEHTNVKPASIIQPEYADENGPVYYLYDLQFDSDGSYIAEGVLVQSRSPWSNITPLAKDKYYDQSRYKEETHWDGFNHPLTLDDREYLP